MKHSFAFETKKILFWKNIYNGDAIFFFEHENDRSPSKRKMDVHLLFKIHSFNMPNLRWLENRLRTLNGNFAEFIKKIMQKCVTTMIKTTFS